MKEDEFEEIIRKGRLELDVEEPDVHAIWEGVQQDLGKRRVLPIRWMAAASVLLLLGSVLFYWLSPNEGTPPLGIDEGNENKELIFSNIDPTLAAEEEKIVQQVKEKEASLNLSTLDQQTYRDIFVELKLLEELHNEFKNDLPEFGEKERLLKTLMKYYERRLQILDRLSNEMEKTEQEEIREQEVII